MVQHRTSGVGGDVELREMADQKVRRRTGIVPRYDGYRTKDPSYLGTRMCVEIHSLEPTKNFSPCSPTTSSSTPDVPIPHLFGG